MNRDVINNKAKAAVVPSILAGRGKPKKTEKKSVSSSYPLPIGTELKFRAEGDIYANLFMYALPEFVQEPWHTIHEFGEPEITFTLLKPISLDDLRWIASAITDAHTIVQTLAISEEYTGERQTDLRIDLTEKYLIPDAKVLSRVVLYARNYAKFSLSQALYAGESRDTFEALYEAAGYPRALLKN